MLLKCFVIQPFSKKYQKLYSDVYAPAIEAAGVDPYKTDEDHSVNIPIESIESEIQKSDFCFAEISEDNPNVWYELGYAIASNKGFCIVCSKQNRESLPFDVRHRKVLFYDAEAPSDFISLKGEITKRFSSLKQQATIVDRVTESDGRANREGEMENDELSVLALIATEQVEPNGYASIYTVKSSVVRFGLTEIAAVLYMQDFRRRDLIELFQISEYNEGEYTACRLTESGWSALQINKHRLKLRTNQKSSVSLSQPREDFSQDLDDEIPF